MAVRHGAHALLSSAAGVDPSSITLESEWQAYFGLEIEAAGAFTVALNADHTRLLRAWREEPEQTKELELQPDANADGGD